MIERDGRRDVSPNSLARGSGGSLEHKAENIRHILLVAFSSTVRKHKTLLYHDVSQLNYPHEQIKS